jgi:outer membrane protein
MSSQLYCAERSYVKRTYVKRTYVNRSLAAAIALLCLPLAAQQSDDEQESSWGLGLGVMSSQKAYTDMDNDTKVIPFISYQNEYIEVLGPNLKYKLPSFELNNSNKFNFNLVGEYDFSDNDPDETPILNGMEERKGGFWAGAQMEWQNDIATVSLEWLTEVSGDSDGSVLNLGIERTWHIGRSYMLTPRVVLSRVDKNYVDYYYGVRADEVRIDRAFYQGEAGLNTEVGVRGIYMIDQKQMIMLDLAVTSLATEIKDSPLVDSSTESRVMLGYIYRF